ncbi:MAG: tetratricopeptide repeat protein, partial [Calditrichia bacterium]|nr:tetratricopeptide repeat protein [Calditrichia bacterium]
NDGNENFTENIISNNFLCASSVYSADMDGDGDIDIFSTSENHHDIRWWENDGMQNFSEHTVSGLLAGASDVFVDDVVGDGDMDVLGTGNRANQIGWWENVGKTSISLEDDPTESRFFTLIRTEGATKAVEAYKKLKSSNPDLILFEADNMNNLALEFLQKRKTEEAAQLYELAISAYPDYVPTYMGLAELHLTTNNQAKANELYQKALNSNPETLAVQNKLKIALMLGDEELFKTTAEDLKSNNQSKYHLNENVLNMMGYRFMQMKMLDNALKIWHLNTDLFPASANVFDSYAEGLMNNGQDKEAIKFYRKSLELNPENKNAVQMIEQIKARNIKEKSDKDAKPYNNPCNI